jgi:transketolase
MGNVDCNRLQIVGPVDEVMRVEPLEEKYRSFGWDVRRIDGHNVEQVVEALESGKHQQGNPIVLLADTVKGKGLSFMEDIAGWHGKAPNREEMLKGLNELGVADRISMQAMLDKAQAYQDNVDRKLHRKMPQFNHDYWWNRALNMKVKMEPTRKGFGQALAESGGDERVVCLGLDISGSITISDFYASKPERKKRWISLGIAEQSATSVAAGNAKEGKLPVFGTYATFAAARNLDQIRTSICYGEFNVMIAGAHGGVSVGPDGATHQALEDLFAMCGFPNMTVVAMLSRPEKPRSTCCSSTRGPKYIRFAREATPVVTDEQTPFVLGKANVIRLRQPGDSFLKAFETML